MRSLFARILLGFVIASAASVLIVVGVSQWFDHPTRFNVVVKGLLAAQLEQARDAYERQGVDGLRRTMAAFERGFAAGLRVTDAAGRDLLTGEDLGAVRTTDGRGGWTFVNRTPALAHSTADGRYSILLPMGRGTVGPLLLRPQIVLAFMTLALICWALARQISRPVLDLQRVVDRFGRGETGVRTRSTRTDELGRLAMAFDHMADRVEDLVQGQRRLLLDISHELRSPLARLTIATDLLRADPRDEASLAQIELEGERLNQLIGEILQAARPATRDDSVGLSAVPIDRAVADVVETCRIEATDGRRIVFAPEAAAGAHVHARREDLRRAIENVVRNAVRYAPPGTGIDVTLAIVPVAGARPAPGHPAPPEGSFVRLTVRDRGPGVPEAALPHLFLPFYRVDLDRERLTGGAGLGLAIARRAVESLGGRVSARNAAPGLEVEIVLPLSRAQAP